MYPDITVSCIPGPCYQGHRPRGGVVRWHENAVILTHVYQFTLLLKYNESRGKSVTSDFVIKVLGET